MVDNPETSKQANPLVWARDAYYCHRTQQDCANCPIKAARYSFKCQMPKTVKKLREQGIPIPKSYLKAPRRRRGEGYEYSLKGKVNLQSNCYFTE